MTAVKLPNTLSGLLLLAVNELHALTKGARAALRSTTGSRTTSSQASALPSLRAQAKQVEDRIAQIKQAAERPAATEQHGDVEISEADNRVRIVFPGKPDAETRSQLKSNGFRWAPSVGAWQRSASDYSWTLARKIVGVS